MRNIVVIGAGTMGNGIAQVFAQNQYLVTLCDINDAALQRGLSIYNRVWIGW
jgi:3-hydroxybutyryl-CoA dehydrogenase